LKDRLLQSQTLHNARVLKTLTSMSSLSRQRSLVLLAAMLKYYLRGERSPSYSPALWILLTHEDLYDLKFLAAKVDRLHTHHQDIILVNAVAAATQELSLEEDDGSV
jgi:hypothetical protein